MDREGRSSSSGDRTGTGLVGVAGGLVEDGRREEEARPDDSDSRNWTKSCESEVDCRDTKSIYIDLEYIQSLKVI